MLLDVMGTLVEDPFYEAMPAHFGMTLQELIACKHPDAWVRFEHGELDTPRFLERFFADGRSYDQEAFVAAVRRAYRFLPGVPALLDALRAANLSLFALSNYPEWWRWIEEELTLSRWLRWDFVSCDTGVRKPAAEAYLGPAHALGVPVEACLLIDDREVNVAAATAVGMQAIRFESAAQVERELQTRGVLPSA